MRPVPDTEVHVRGKRGPGPCGLPGVRPGRHDRDARPGPPDLEWTYLDPAFGDPEPQTCHGRHQLLHALERQAESGLTSQVEEIASSGDQVMVVVHTPGLDQRRARSASDRNYLVLTLRHGQVVAMRACHDRAEAAGISTTTNTSIWPIRKMSRWPVTSMPAPP